MRESGSTKAVGAETGRTARSEVPAIDSAAAPARDSSSNFTVVHDSQLDHLVPVEERVEPGIEQDEEPEQLYGGRLPTNQEKAVALKSLRDNCKAVEDVSVAQRCWSTEGMQRVHAGLTDLVKVPDPEERDKIMTDGGCKRQTPSARDFEIRDAVIARIDAIVRKGLLQFTGMHVAHYGSYTSRLFTPNGDLDIAIEGTLIRDPSSTSLKVELNRCEGLSVGRLGKDEKSMLLKALCNKLERQRISSDKPERILHARVPIIKFKDWSSGIPCDMAVGSGGARFKSTVLRHLSTIDDRLPALIRLIKMWAKANHMNDAAAGTFNTFALSLMVVFLLQTRTPAILPPICDLFGLPAETVEGRPLHRGREADMTLLEGSEQKAQAWPRSANQETVVELLSSFFALYTTAIGVWKDNRNSRWAFKVWPNNYVVPVEDPFDATDNCARSIFASNTGLVKDAFFLGLLALRDLSNQAAADGALRALFTARPPPEIRHPFRNGARWQEGWAGRGARMANGSRPHDHDHQDKFSLGLQDGSGAEAAAATRRQNPGEIISATLQPLPPPGYAREHMRGGPRRPLPHDPRRYLPAQPSGLQQQPPPPPGFPGDDRGHSSGGSTGEQAAMFGRMSLGGTEGHRQGGSGRPHMPPPYVQHQQVMMPPVVHFMPPPGFQHGPMGHLGPQPPPPGFWAPDSSTSQRGHPHPAPYQATHVDPLQRLFAEAALRSPDRGTGQHSGSNHQRRTRQDL